MNGVKFFLFALIALLTVSCNKTKEVINDNDRTLVIISDIKTDLVMAIQGSVRAEFPDVEIHYYQTKLFDIKEASYLLNEALTYYPPGTFFAAIVEPGADMERIVFETGEKKVLCPDNGVCTWAVANNPADKYYFIDNPKVYLKSSDIPFTDFYKFAILSLLSNKPLSGFGEVCISPVVYDIQNPVFENDTTKGEVLYLDNFGNCVTNITTFHLGNAAIGNQFSVLADTSSFGITYGTIYASVPVGENVFFINSSGRLEMAVNYGNLSAKYNITAGSRVFLNKNGK